MTKRIFGSCILGFAVTSFACTGVFGPPTADSIRLSLPATILDSNPTPSGALALDSAGTPILEYPVALTVVPSDVAVAIGTDIQCIGFGEVSVVASSQGLTTTATTDCQPADIVGPPAAIEVAVMDGPVFQTSPVPFAVQVVDAQGRTVQDSVLDVRISPTEIAAFEDGTLTCFQVGPATVTAAGHGFSETVSLDCRPVVEILAEAEVVVIVGGDRVSVSASALGPLGKSIEGVPRHEIGDSSIAEVAGGRVQGLALGTTAVRWSLGNSVAETNVTVMDRVIADTVSLGDGNASTMTLGRGKYSAVVAVRSGNSSYGVTLDWVGGSGCSSHQEAQRIESQCTISETGSIVLTNPTTFGFGPAATGNITVYRLPDSTEVSRGALSSSECPEGASTQMGFADGERATLAAIHPEDAYSGSEYEAAMPLTGTVTGDLHNNDSCWFGGGFRGDDGTEFYFYKAAFQATGTM